MEQWVQTNVVTSPCERRTGAIKTAVVFGPVAPEWTGSGFCTPLVQSLNDGGYDVYIIDSIPILLDHDGASVRTMLSHYMEFVTSKFGVPDLIAGYAYGGSLAMVLAPLFPNVPDVISVSGPGISDAPLRRQLGVLIAALEEGRLSDALELLSHSVTAVGRKPSALQRDKFDGADSAQAIARMIAGFEFLLQLDVREGLSSFDGRLIAMTGELSKLATRDTLGFEPGLTPRFFHAEIPNAGMRILLEEASICRKILNEWITYDQENSYLTG